MFPRSFISLLFVISTLNAADKPHWVFLESESTPTRVQLTNRATQRLLTRGSMNTPGNFKVSESHLALLRAAGYQIRHTSRFLNAVSVVIKDNDQLATLHEFPFVQSISPVAQYPRKRFEEISGETVLARGSSLGYGESEGQNEMLKIPQIHRYGYDGSGVLIGVFDMGFLTVHPAFDGMDIQAQYDFVDHEVDASGPGDWHGINVLSAIGGYDPGDLIGPAYRATFLLARTEDVSHESRAEEDNWVAALEWADSLGVDIITTSLNYFKQFDDPNENYRPSALDGQTTIIARAANIAAERGILVVNSAGNEGDDPSSIWPPSDSPHVLSVGWVDTQQEISRFSGRGPTYDGRIKPNIVAQGSLVYMASGVSGYIRRSGTSYAAPQIAGLAALLLQAHPQLSPDSVIAIFEEHGDRSFAPNNTYGWGIPDITSLFPNLNGSTSKNCLIYPNPGQSGEIRMVLSNAVSELAELATLYDIRGMEITAITITQESERIIKISIPAGLGLTSQLMILSVKSGDRVYAGKFVYLKS